MKKFHQISLGDPHKSPGGDQQYEECDRFHVINGTTLVIGFPNFWPRFPLWHVVQYLWGIWRAKMRYNVTKWAAIVISDPNHWLQYDERFELGGRDKKKSTQIHTMMRTGETDEENAGLMGKTEEKNRGKAKALSEVSAPREWFRRVFELMLGEPLHKIPLFVRTVTKWKAPPPLGMIATGDLRISSDGSAFVANSTQEDLFNKDWDQAFDQQASIPRSPGATREVSFFPRENRAGLCCRRFFKTFLALSFLRV